MNKVNFYAIFKEYAQNMDKPGNIERKKNIIKICKDQPYLLIMPGYNKSYYNEAANLIIDLGYDVFKDNLEDLLTWLQDENWPAADKVIDFLSSIPQKELITAIKNVLRIAYDDKDDFWIYGIEHLLRNAELFEYFYSDSEFKKILEFSDEINS